MGGLYTVDNAETQSPAITTTYTLAGQKVAVREGGTLSYLVTDHLGSVIALLDGDGDLIEGSQQRYYPFGATVGRQHRNSLVVYWSAHEHFRFWADGLQCAFYVAKAGSLCATGYDCAGRAAGIESLQLRIQ